MTAMPLSDGMGSRNDDPRKLRELLSRSAALASEHSVGSVLVGMAAEEGDVHFPDFVDFVESELRVEDRMFRMTRERAVLCLADIGTETAREVLARLLRGFTEQASHAESPRYQLHFLGVEPGTRVLAVKDVLPALFAPGSDGAPD
jgi:hypothetical protein